MFVLTGCPYILSGLKLCSENVWAFFPQGQKQTVRKAGFDCTWTNILFASFGVSLLSPCDRFGQIKKEKS